MQLKTILNRCHKFKSFVYDQARFVGEAIEVTVLPRANAKAICSHCAEPAPVYDHVAERRFEFIPIWGYRVFFLYRMRRVDCRDCGVKVERVLRCTPNGRAGYIVRGRETAPVDGARDVPF